MSTQNLTTVKPSAEEILNQAQDSWWLGEPRRRDKVTA